VPLVCSHLEGSLVVLLQQAGLEAPLNLHSWFQTVVPFCLSGHFVEPLEIILFRLNGHRVRFTDSGHWLQHKSCDGFAGLSILKFLLLAKLDDPLRAGRLQRVMVDSSVYLFIRRSELLSKNFSCYLFHKKYWCLIDELDSLTIRFF